MKTAIALCLIAKLISPTFLTGKTDYGLMFQSRDSDGLHLIISNIRNKNGYIQVNVFDSETGYPEKSKFRFSLSKDTMTSGKLRMFIPLKKSGSFCITVLDDENRNEKMDFIFGIKPKEGFGFSNNPRVPGRKPPPFSDARINYEGGKTEVLIIMKYI
jgi:uncharacterized protein (DUF2141 family)